MRKIKFRAKRMDSNEWLFGSLFVDKNKHFYIKEPNGKLYLIENKDTIGQYTGLKDKNGKEIYEGDILKNNLSKLPFALVCWHQSGYFFCDCNMGSHPSDYEYNEYTPLGEVLNFHIDSKKVEYEVIGNIFDNPELLKQ